MTQPLSEPEDGELRDSLLGEVLADFETRMGNEAFCITLYPLGDGIGWRSQVNHADFEDPISRASAHRWSEAVSLAVARASAWLEEYETEKARQREG